MYAYQKFGKGIYLKGTLEDQVFSFQEYDENHKESAIMSFKYENHLLIGYWAKDPAKKWKLVARRK